MLTLYIDVQHYVNRLLLVQHDSTLPFLPLAHPMFLHLLQKLLLYTGVRGGAVKEEVEIQSIISVPATSRQTAQEITVYSQVFHSCF